MKLQVDDMAATKPANLRMTDAFEREESQWPADVDFILSALEAAGAGAPANDKRGALRVPYRVVGQLHLYSALPDEVAVTIYTRDVCPRSLGFVTQVRLPLGYGGILVLNGPDGEEMRLDVTLLRCREAVPGWYEGALYFNREQWGFTAEGLSEKPETRSLKLKDVEADQEE